jgi:hypothetical protein
MLEFHWPLQFGSLKHVISNSEHQQRYYIDFDSVSSVTSASSAKYRNQYFDGKVAVFMGCFRLQPLLRLSSDFPYAQGVYAQHHPKGVEFLSLALHPCTTPWIHRCVDTVPPQLFTILWRTTTVVHYSLEDHHSCSLFFGGRALDVP